MRFIEIKIFEVNSEYFLLIEKIKLSNKSKIIEQEYCKEVQTKKDAEYYLTTILNNKEYRKYRLFINYISNDVIIEVINNSKELKNNYLNELNTLYPNYQLEYDVMHGEIKINANNKKKICALIKNNVFSEIKNFINLVNKKNIYFGLDVFLLQSFLNDNNRYFHKKFIVLIQKNYNYYRVYQIYYGKIINYIVIKDTSKEFEMIFNNILSCIDNKVDEVIVDVDYKEYLSLTEKLYNVNIILIDYLDKINFIDERKIPYGKKI
jgi:hypothetical protein